jgi:hypothetical protein
MFGLFGKKKKDDLRDIEQVIFDVAENNKDEDYHRLYELLVGKELYMPVDPASLPQDVAPGSKITTDASNQIRIKNVQGPNGQFLIPASTSSEHQIVQGGHVGINWLEYLEMVLKVPGTWGALLQGKTSYVGFDKERIKYILGKYNA